MAHPDASQKNSWRRYLFDRTPNIFKAFYGVRYMGTIGMLMDSVTQGVNDALYSPYIESSLFSFDAVEPVSNELNIPPTPLDDTVTHRERCLNSWDTWQHAGSEYTMERQLELATGYDVSVRRDLSYGSWSDFTVDFAAGSHPITDLGPELGTFVLGRPFPELPPNDATNPNTILGPSAVTSDTNYAIRRIVLHWKPSRYRCTVARFFIGGDTYGDGGSYGDADLFYGGDVYYLPIQA